MTEHIVVIIGGTKILLRKAGVHTLLHCDSKKWYSTNHGANLKTMREWYGERQISAWRGGGERSCRATNDHTETRQQHSALRHSLATIPLNREI